jgi:hypothetical protein
MRQGQFYTRIRNKVVGPLSLAQLRTLRDRGDLAPSSPISKDQQTWHAAAAITGLFPNGAGPAATKEDEADHFTVTVLSAPSETAVRAPPAGPVGLYVRSFRWGILVGVLLALGPAGVAWCIHRLQRADAAPAAPGEQAGGADTRATAAAPAEVRHIVPASGDAGTIRPELLHWLIAEKPAAQVGVVGLAASPFTPGPVACVAELLVADSVERTMAARSPAEKVLLGAYRQLRQAEQMAGRRLADSQQAVKFQQDVLDLLGRLHRLRRDVQNAVMDAEQAGTDLKQFRADLKDLVAGSARQGRAEDQRRAPLQLVQAQLDDLVKTLPPVDVAGEPEPRVRDAIALPDFDRGAADHPLAPERKDLDLGGKPRLDLIGLPALWQERRFAADWASDTLTVYEVAGTTKKPWATLTIRERQLVLKWDPRANARFQKWLRDATVLKVSRAGKDQRFRWGADAPTRPPRWDASRSSFAFDPRSSLADWSGPELYLEAAEVQGGQPLHKAGRDAVLLESDDLLLLIWPNVRAGKALSQKQALLLIPKKGHDDQAAAKPVLKSLSIYTRIKGLRVDVYTYWNDER